MHLGGFTLVEIMLGFVLINLLLVLGVPCYQRIFHVTQYWVGTTNG
jgi:Tfp pilus assembly protein FimT